MKKYEIQKLNEYDDSYEGKRDLISIHTNQKGSLIKLSVDQNINMIGIVDYKIGKPARGNHYHEFKNEYIYLLEGRVNAYFKDLDNSEIEHIIIEKGTLIRIMPGCVHAFTALEEGYAIEYCSNLSEEIKDDSYDEKII